VVQKREEFTLWLASRANKKIRDAAIRCNDCYEREREEQRAIARKNIEHVVKEGDKKKKEVVIAAEQQ
jgi:hypothetical protein